MQKQLNRLLDIATWAFFIALAVFVMAKLGGGGSPPPNRVPFNATLFFALLAGPILLSLAVAVALFAVQQYRASNGTRDRGWEEQW